MVPNKCWGCQYKSKINPGFCNNYLKPLQEAINECIIDDADKLNEERRKVRLDRRKNK